jgi:hypothetical protein
MTHDAELPIEVGRTHPEQEHTTRRPEKDPFAWSTTSAQFIYTEYPGEFKDPDGKRMNRGAALGIFTKTSGAVIESSGGRTVLRDLLLDLAHKIDKYQP